MEKCGIKYVELFKKMYILFKFQWIKSNKTQSVQPGGERHKNKKTAQKAKSRRAMYFIYGNCFHMGERM